MTQQTEHTPPNPPGSRHAFYEADCPTHGRTMHGTAVPGLCIACAHDKEREPSGTPSEDADGFLVTLHGTDYEFLRSDTGKGWFATREDGAVTAGYYSDTDDLVTAIEDDSIRYE
jgi:hypothetical protein